MLNQLTEKSMLAVETDARRRQLLFPFTAAFFHSVLFAPTQVLDMNVSDDSSQEARASVVKTLVDEVLDQVHSRIASQVGQCDRTEGGVKETASQSDESPKKSPVRKRKSTRSTRWRCGNNQHKVFGQKGRSRRFVFKSRLPQKSPSACAVPVTSDFVFHRGQYLQVGDIVSIIDPDDRQKYYAQIRGFLTTEYCEYSAALSWLLPTKEAPADGTFDAAFYIMGPEEDIPRPLEFMHFEQHAPPDYFTDCSNPHVPPSQTNGYVWTNLSPRIVRRPLNRQN